MATQSDPAPPVNAAQLEKWVAPIALYPDPLLAQVLAAVTFPDQIPGASEWANKNKNLKGDQLVDKMTKSDLPWDPSIQALIPFPSVLDLMNKNLDASAQLGNAVLSNRTMVMDAVQRMRKKARDYGNLDSNAQMVVTASGSPQIIEIQPPKPDVIYVPVYNPTVVYYPATTVVQPPPPAGASFVAGMFVFMTFVAITNSFRSSWWGPSCGFGWHSHTVIIFGNSWGRSWNNRGVYVHGWGGYNRNFYSRPNAYVNRPINVNINNPHINVNNNYRGNNNVNIGNGRNDVNIGSGRNNRDDRNGRNDRNERNDRSTPNRNTPSKVNPPNRSTGKKPNNPPKNRTGSPTRKCGG